LMQRQAKKMPSATRPRTVNPTFAYWFITFPVHGWRAPIRRTSSLLGSLAFEIDIRDRLSVVVARDETGGLFFDGPRRREAAFSHSNGSNVRELTLRRRDAEVPR